MELRGARVKIGNLFIALIIFFISCKQEQKAPPVELTTSSGAIDIPDFNADSAYVFIEEQLAFGPRVLSSEGHAKCAEYLIDKLGNYTDTVIVQRANVKTYDGKVHAIQNIIGSIKPHLNNRIFVCAHWDTRHVADHDTERRDEPILGANDGGSGVAVVLELARQLSSTNPKLGIDFILFDAEDYGQPDNERPFVPDSYCLGSQYWAKNLHKPNYYARFGILLDMVGAKNATFTQEGTSMRYAPDIMREVWKTAHSLDYSKYFLIKETKPITDDHLYINSIAGIPTIDIIEYSEETPTNFGHYWHTHGDNLAIIDKATLKAVGQTVIAYMVKKSN